MSQREDRGRAYRMIAEYSSIIFILPSAVVGGYFAGVWLDGWLGTGPWLTITFVLLGSVAGFVEVFRILLRRQ
jgi:ATP synthase protein I